jgi:putative transposase
MNFDPEKHHRRSIRLKGYDYSRAGLYFITICVQNRLHLFGDVNNGKMLLNDAGRMIEKWYYELGMPWIGSKP